jgi:hypothetical protein
LIPVFVAFSFLAVAWLLVAVGMRRQDWGEPARQTPVEPTTTEAVC